MEILISIRRSIAAYLPARLRHAGRSLKPFAFTLSLTLVALLGMAPSLAHANDGPSVVFSGVTQTLITA